MTACAIRNDSQCALCSEHQFVLLLCLTRRYLAVVTKSREECLKFHKACTEDLKAHVGVLRKMAQSIKSIDSEGNSSINWDR